MTVAEAIESPLADETAYRHAAEAYLRKRFSIRLAIDDVAGAPPDARRIAQGIDATKTGAIYVSGIVTNDGALDALIVPAVHLPRASLNCKSVQLGAGAAGGTWCVLSGVDGTPEYKAVAVMEALKEFDGRVATAEATLGSPVRHLTSRSEASIPAAWEMALGVQEEASADIDKRRREDLASRGPVPPTAWGALALIAALLSIGGVAHYRFAQRPLVPRFVLVGYLVLVVGALFVSAADKGTGAPLSGALTVLAELAMGLPWSLSLLTPEYRLPDTSAFPWIFTIGNAALLFVFSSPGRR